MYCFKPNLLVMLCALFESGQVYHVHLSGRATFYIAKTTYIDTRDTLHLSYGSSWGVVTTQNKK